MEPSTAHRRWPFHSPRCGPACSSYVRDFSYDEDRCRVYVRDLPRNLACLTNTAISLIRCQTGFRYVPEANPHFAARSQEALDLLLNPPTP